jgi:hypothetical protein
MDNIDDNSKIAFIVVMGILLLILWSLVSLLSLVSKNRENITNSFLKIKQMNINKALILTAIAGIIIISFSLLWAFVIRPYQKEQQDKNNYQQCIQEVCKGNNNCAAAPAVRAMLDSCVKMK